jgi:threonine aldolase
LESNITKNFASDNNSGVHPEIMEAMMRVNVGHVVGYGADFYTERAIRKFKEYFGEDIEVFFVFNGTGANVTGLKTITESFNAIICSSYAHINSDECGAPEKFTGCKLLTIPSVDGKIRVREIEPLLKGLRDQHHSQPKVISITQATELGKVYTVEEIRAIADFAHNNGLYLHMDGARIANAAASLGLTLKELTKDVGVDILSFGGTKNGMMYGEAVVFFNPDLAPNFKFFRKQGMQLASKMRYIAAQFEALLTDDLWLRNAKNSNNMAQYLAGEASKIPQIQITQEVEANGVFAQIPREWVTRLQEHYFFYVWNPQDSIVRWMTSFDTTEEDVRDFIDIIRELAEESSC